MEATLDIIDLIRQDLTSLPWYLPEKVEKNSKQNIDFQYDLIENGYEENARWKQLNNL